MEEAKPQAAWGRRSEMGGIEPSYEQRRELVARVYAGDEDLNDVAGVLKLDLLQLTDVVDEKFEVTLRVLRVLQDFRYEHFVNRYKFHAVVRLVELLSQKDDLDLARRSCVDLLRTDFRRVGKRRRKVSVTMEQEEEVPESVDQERVMELLREIGCGGRNSKLENRSSKEEDKEGNEASPGRGEPGAGEVSV